MQSSATSTPSQRGLGSPRSGPRGCASTADAAASRSVCRDQPGQQEARRQAGDGESRHREDGQLRESAHAREQEGEVGDAGAGDTGGERRPQGARIVPRVEAAVLVTEEVHRVVLRDADEGEPECERDAVHRAEGGADGGEAGEAGARERQQAEHQHGHAAIGDQQQQHHAERGEPAEPLRLPLGALLHEHREGAGAARPRARSARARPRRRSNAACSASAAARWPCGSKPGCARFGDQQRLPAGSCRTRRRTESAAVARVATTRRASAARASDRAAATARAMPAAGEARSRRRSANSARRNDSSRRTAVERRREQVAVGEQRVRGSRRGCPRRWRPSGTPGCRAGRRPGRGRSRRAASGSAPCDREQQHARSRALADLLQHQPLLRRARRRQEQPQVGADDERAVHEPPERGNDRDPGCEQQAPARRSTSVRARARRCTTPAATRARATRAARRDHRGRSAMTLASPSGSASVRQRGRSCRPSTTIERQPALESLVPRRQLEPASVRRRPARRPRSFARAPRGRR